MKTILITISFMACGLWLQAQEMHPCDCRDRLELEGLEYYNPVSAPGPGTIHEIRPAFIEGALVTFEREHHSSWILLTAPGDCLLELTIHPEDTADDYDFMIYRFHDPATCDSIMKNMLLPVRSVISRNDAAIASVTGLRQDAEANHVPFGPGPAFANPLKLNAGGQHLLVIDNVYEGGSGFRLELSYLDCKEPEPAIPDAGTRLLIRVSDSTGTALDADILVRQKYLSQEGPDTLLTVSASSAEVLLPPQVHYMVQVRREGFLAWSESILTPRGAAERILDVRLDSMHVGKSLYFDKIYFRPGTAQFMPGTKDALQQVYRLMRGNPGITVEVQGHVNQPHNLISRLSASETRSLSDERAQAVCNYLVRRGIDSERMVPRGYGNSRMIYPYARSEDEMALNRRVEIQILSIAD